MGEKRNVDPVEKAERNASVALWSWRAYVGIAAILLGWVVIDRFQTATPELTTDTVLGFLAFFFSILATYLMVGQLEAAHAQMLQVQEERRNATLTVTYENPDIA